LDRSAFGSRLKEEREHNGLAAQVREPNGVLQQAVPRCARNAEIRRHLTDLWRHLRRWRRGLLRSDWCGEGCRDEKSSELSLT